MGYTAPTWINGKPPAINAARLNGLCSTVQTLDETMPTKQDKLTFDNVPTSGSSNPVKSGGIKTALDGKAAASHTHAMSDVIGLTTAIQYGPAGIVGFQGSEDFPLASCVAEITPVQAGSGDPSPSNIRPISGWTGAKVFQSGKNILSFTKYNIIKREYGITFDVVTNENGDLVKIVANGTDTSTNPSFSQVYIQIPASYAHIFSGKILTGGAANFNIQLENTYSPYTIFAKDSGSGATISSSITEARMVNILCRVPRGATVSNLEIFPMIREAGTDATYEPCQGKFIDYTFPTEAGTVYGGTLDVLKGTLTVDRASVTITGGLRYYQEHTNHYRFNFNALDGKAEPNSTSKLLSDIGVPISAQGFSSASVGVYIGNGNTMGALYLNKSLVSPNNESANAWVASHPVQIVYPLETPITYQLTPQMVTTLAGANNIWADTGNVTVAYGAFPGALQRELPRAFETYYITTGRARDAALGDCATAEGHKTTASGDYSHAEGYGTQATGWGYGAHAEGLNTRAHGYFTHAEGINTFASGEEPGVSSIQDLGGAHAEGFGTIAGGEQSHAEGKNTISAGIAAHAEGNESSAGGKAAHAEGSSTDAVGDSSHAEGYTCQAIGIFSHAEGMYTIASGPVQHVFGQYNKSDTTSVEIVGWGTGTADSNRKNIRTLATNGNMTIAGTLTQSSDARLKDVAGEIPDVSSIRAVRFKWNDTNGEHDDKDHIGYIAQEVEQLAPFLVGDDSNGYKSLDYIALLCAKVEMLERRVKELEEKKG